MRQLIVLGCVLTTLAAALACLTAAVAVASGLSGGGWRLPPASLSWVARALHGAPVRRWFTGMTGSTPQPAHTWLVWVVAAVLFLILMQVLAVAALWIRAYTGAPAQGMATGRDVDDALGLSSLHDAGRQVRPDLNPRSRGARTRRGRAERRAAPHGEQPARRDPGPWGL